MDPDAVIGSIVVAMSLLLLALLVVWSRRIIRMMAARGGRSTREIERKLNGGE